jgi:hypothetical protein
VTPFLDSQRTTPPPRLAVDAKGYVWRVYNDGHWSMAPSNPDNSPVPEPITYYASIGEAIGFDEEIQASIEEAKAEGRREALAPVLDLIGWWETDGTDSRKVAAARIRDALRGAE